LIAVNNKLGLLVGNTVLYKYINKEHLKQFLKNGALKIGTLYEYRDEEGFGSVIGDEQEGFHKTELDSPKGREIDLAGDSPEAEYFREHVLREDQKDTKVKIIMESGAKLISQKSSPNYYIYCVTSEYDEDVMAEFNCNACIEILNPDKFFKAISRVIRYKGTPEGVFKIQYGQKTTDYLNPHKVHPAVLKDKKYSSQAEVRAIWNPEKIPRGPLFVNAPKALKYCREFNP